MDHSHPGGTPPSPADVLNGASRLYRYLHNPKYTDDQKAFIFENFSITAVGSYTYSIHYNNPLAALNISNQYTSSISYTDAKGIVFTGINAQLAMLQANGYSPAAALLALFGNSISLMKSPNTKTPGKPNTVIPDSTGKNTTERITKC